MNSVSLSLSLYIVLVTGYLMAFVITDSFKILWSVVLSMILELKFIVNSILISRVCQACILGLTCMISMGLSWKWLLLCIRQLSYLMWSYLFFLVQLDTTAYIIIAKLIMGLSL